MTEQISMKKTITIILVAVLAVSLFILSGCEDASTPTNTSFQTIVTANNQSGSEDVKTEITTDRISENTNMTDKTSKDVSITEDTSAGTSTSTSSSEEKTVEVNINNTGIKAESVYITSGYAGIRQSIPSNPDEVPIIPSKRIALIDKSGNFLFDWKDTELTYSVSDGIVSLTYNKYTRLDPFGTSGNCAFFELDGTDAFDYSNIKDSDRMINGYAAAFLKNSSVPVIIDKTGKIVYTFPDDFKSLPEFEVGSGFDMNKGCAFSSGFFSEGLIGCSERRAGEHDFYDLNHTYYLDISGKKVLDFTPGGPNGYYSELYPFSHGYAIVLGSSGYGFIDKTAKLTIPCVYQAAKGCFGDLFAVQKDGYWGYINNKNQVVIPFEYSAVYGGEGGFASVGKDGKYGIVDYNNKIVVPLEYDDISGVENGTAYAIKNGIVYVISIICEA